MGIVFAIFLSVGGVLSLAAYNGTYHFSNGPNCGPIDVLGYNFNVDIDCLTFSRGELLIAIACFGLAVLTLIFGRGNSEHSRW